MKKVFIRFLSCFILDREKRRKFRNKHFNKMDNINYHLDEIYEKAMQMCKDAVNLADIGCGPYPNQYAKYAIDLNVEATKHRSSGSQINIDSITKKGCKFINAPCEEIPVEDHFFDVSISTHMIEHVDDPIRACKEIMRVSKQGVIVCPSIFAEYIFGRRAHKWYVSYKGNTLIFIEKSDHEMEPLWGGVPLDKKLKEDTNPFEILLNYDNWYNGNEKFPRISKKLQAMWGTHHWAIENCFIWKDSFEIVVIHKDGKIDTYDKDK